MEARLFHRIPALYNLPPELRLIVYKELVHDPNPIYTRTDRPPSRLRTLMSLRQTRKLTSAELDFIELLRLKHAFYEDNTFLFSSSRVLEEYALRKPQSVLDQVRSVIIDEYDRDSRSWVRGQSTVRTVYALAQFHRLKRVGLHIGTFDWCGISAPHFNLDGWLEDLAADESRGPCRWLLNGLLNRAGIHNRPIVEAVLRPCNDDQPGFEYSGKHTNVKLTYRESAAGARDWSRYAAPVDMDPEQSEMKLLTWVQQASGNGD